MFGRVVRGHLKKNYCHYDAEGVSAVTISIFSIVLEPFIVFKVWLLAILLP